MRVVGVIALAALLGAPLRAQDTTATRDSLPSSGVIDTAAFRDLAVPDPVRRIRTGARRNELDVGQAFGMQ